MTRRWTPAEKAQLEELYKLHAAPEIAQIMGKDVGAVYSAIARNKFKKDDDFFMSRQVASFCLMEPGQTCAEIAHRLQKDYDNVGTAIRRLLGTGELFRVGKGKNFRYYADKEAADIAQAQALEADAKHREEQRRKKQDARNLARKLQRAKEAKAFKREQERRAKRLKAQQTVVQMRKVLPVEEPQKPANVIVPEGVKVQVIPTPPSRFHFEPPPGWRGQITHDWMDRRLNQTGRNYELTD